VRWHGAGFRRYWHWKSRRRGGRPQVQSELRALIRQMSVEKPLWGAPRIHGELLKLGFEVSQSSVAKYMARRRGPPSQGWRAFLRNHAPDIATMDVFVVLTIGFELLYAFVIVRVDRRDLIWIDVTRHPTAEWIARQITETFPWNEAPRYLIRDKEPEGFSISRPEFPVQSAPKVTLSPPRLLSVCCSRMPSANSSAHVSSTARTCKSRWVGEMVAVGSGTDPLQGGLINRADGFRAKIASYVAALS
jgi:hypothetical protein